MTNPEQQTYTIINKQLRHPERRIQDSTHTHHGGARGVAVRGFPLKFRYGFADSQFSVDHQAAVHTLRTRLCQLSALPILLITLTPPWRASEVRRSHE